MADNQIWNFVDGIIKVYNNEICDVIDNYKIARAYQNGGF